MGCSIEFYAGDATAIGTAFADLECDDILADSQARSYADLSLHLAPEDLDRLSEIAAARTKTEPRLLWDTLGAEVGALDEGETGAAYVVDPGWVAMMSALDQRDAEGLAVQWMRKVSERCGEDLEVNQDAVRALEALFELCKAATDQQLAVVMVWYL